MAFTFNSFFKGTKGTGAFDVVHVQQDSTDGFAFTMVSAIAVMEVSYKGRNDRTFVQKLQQKFSKIPMNKMEDAEKVTFIDGQNESYAGRLVKVRESTASIAHFLRAWAYVEPAMSVDATRENLSAVRIHKNRMVATDGHRLNMYEGAWSPSHDDLEFSLPSSVGHLLVRSMYHAFLEGTGEFGYRVDGTQHEFTVSSPSLTVRLRYLFEGQFPAYEQVIPSSENKSLTVKGDSAAAFIEVWETAPLKLAKSGNAHSRTFRIDQDSMVVLDLDGVTPVVTLPGSVVNTENRNEERSIVCAVASKYLKEAVDDGGEFEIEFHDELSPIVWRQGAATGVVMPMRA